MGMGEGTEQGSVTALAVLAGVCVASTERDASVRVNDPYALQLTRWSDGQLAVARVRALHPLVRRMVERRNPGSYGYTIARIHHMDAIVRREVAAGLDRLVILGAGYDTRAYRMSDSLRGVSVFEVDHPATSREKRARLKKALGSVPADVTYVEVDFTHQNLLERLADKRPRALSTDAFPSLRRRYVPARHGSVRDVRSDSGAYLATHIPSFRLRIRGRAHSPRPLLRRT